MSYSFETLQDFVVNLLNDEAAKAAYLADPLGALSEAGLGDLTPADVQEVLPLVADSLPAGIPTDLSDLPIDLPELPDLGDLPVDGLPDLSDLPHLPELGDLPHLPELGDLPHLPELPELGDLPVELPVNLPELPDLSDLPHGLPTLETPVGDLTATVDDAAAFVDLDGDVLSTGVSALASNPAESDAPTASAYVGSDFGDLAAGGKLDPEEFGGSIAGSTELADVGLGAVGHNTGEFAAWGGADTVVGDLAGGVHAGPDGFALATESPLGNFAVNSDGDLDIEPADLSDVLDTDHLGDTGDAVVGTIAHYVSTGADTIAGTVGGGADNLGDLLTGPLTPVADAIESGSDTVTDGIQHGGDTVSEHLTNLPTLHDLPLPQLPELPQLPDVPGLDDLPVDHLPDLDDLPVDLPSLPVDLPVDTSAVTGLVTNNPVVDAVHDSPVGGLVQDVTGHLPSVADLPGDLDLGL